VCVCVCVRERECGQYTLPQWVSGEWEVAVQTKMKKEMKEDKETKEVR